MAGLWTRLRRRLLGSRRDKNINNTQEQKKSKKAGKDKPMIARQQFRVYPDNVAGKNNGGNKDTQAENREQFLLDQINEFREHAQQLQNLLNSKDAQTQELESKVDSGQKKIDVLENILKEREDKTEQLTLEVERQIDGMIEKVSLKMDAIEKSMKEESKVGQILDAQRTEELKEALEVIKDQLTLVKSELSEKVHAENVTCFRNIADLFKEMNETVSRMASEVSAMTVKTNNMKKYMITAIVFSGLSFVATIGMIFVYLGSSMGL